MLKLKLASLIVAGLAGGLLAACGPAHDAARDTVKMATGAALQPATVERAYVTEVRQLGIGPAWTDAKLIAAGHATCDGLAAKLPPALIVQDGTDSGLAARDVERIMQAAADVLCPAELPVVAGYLASEATR